MKTFINENGEKEYIIHSMTKKEMLQDINETKSYLCQEIYEKLPDDRNCILDKQYQEYPDLKSDEFDDHCAQIYIDWQLINLDRSDNLDARYRIEQATKQIHPMLKFATI